MTPWWIAAAVFLLGVAVGLTITLGRANLALRRERDWCCRSAAVAERRAAAMRRHPAGRARR